MRNLEEAVRVDCVILAVVHDTFKEITLNKLKGIMNANPILLVSFH